MANLGRSYRLECQGQAENGPCGSPEFPLAERLGQREEVEDVGVLWLSWSMPYTGHGFNAISHNPQRRTHSSQLTTILSRPSIFLLTHFGLSRIGVLEY
jgi:hypothetical protein